jgi:hypothetical protein
MAIFNGTSPSYQQTPNNASASVGTSATQIYNTTSFTAVGGTVYSFPAGAVLRDLTIVNTGAVTCFIGTSSVTASTGIPLLAGEQLTIQGSHKQAESGNASWNLYAITASGTTQVECSLATQVAVA